jgi:hypothetical protein
MTRITRIEDLIDELDQLKAYGVPVSEASYRHARQADIRLLSLLDRREAALLILRRTSGQTGVKPKLF